MFRKVKKKPDATQVYQTAEENAITELAWKDYYSHNCTYDLAPLAIPFLFQTGLRIGELCAVRYEDIESPDYIHIQRMYNKDTKKIIEHAKTDCGDRQVILTQKAKEIIETARSRQKETGADSTGYIFSMDGKPLPQYAVAYRFRKYRKEYGTTVKSSHKVRKTYISTLLDAHVNINTVRELVGHSDERTPLKNYCFDRNTEAEKGRKSTRLRECNTSVTVNRQKNSLLNTLIKKIKKPGNPHKTRLFRARKKHCQFDSALKK